jgi:hypothetical protein
MHFSLTISESIFSFCPNLYGESILSDHMTAGQTEMVTVVRLLNKLKAKAREKTRRK